MHTSVSGVADHLATSDAHAIRLAREAVQDLGDASPSRPDSVSTQDLDGPQCQLTSGSAGETQGDQGAGAPLERAG
jgi:acetyl-CoA carboxylase carboxyltransferase component